MKMHSWTLDPAHSEVRFKVRHLLISKVSGEFRIFNGSLVAGDMDTFENATLDAVIDVYSIDTNETDRDEHLKSPEFLDADNFPEIKFRGHSFRHVSGDEFRFTADVTLKGVSRSLEFQLSFGGQTRDGFGNQRAGLHITGKIDRKDFGIHYDAKNESGSLVIGEEVQLDAELQFLRDL